MNDFATLFAFGFGFGFGREDFLLKLKITDHVIEFGGAFRTSQQLIISASAITLDLAELAFGGAAGGLALELGHADLHEGGVGQLRDARAVEGAVDELGQRVKVLDGVEFLGFLVGVDEDDVLTRRRFVFQKLQRALQPFGFLFVDLPVHLQIADVLVRHFQPLLFLQRFLFGLFDGPDLVDALLSLGGQHGMVKLVRIA